MKGLLTPATTVVLFGVVLLTAGLWMLAPWVALVVLGALLTTSGVWYVASVPKGDR